MALPPGTSLTHYEILGPLGAGAMGEVYRAKDTRLQREVAIKVLPEHFANDEERLKRFEREAKTLASLNHPNVAQIFGVDQVGDICFLVLELVPGESLEERLKRGPLALEEALDVCKQIAEGLEAAHEAGVIHRDLKPANVRVTPEGKVKVLDFGLAKTALESSKGSSTDSVLSTEAGRLLGTPTYMAPEQARGKAIDKRVDIWAFGCVLYECLSAQRAFAGESLTDVLAAVIERQPDFSKLPASTPPRVLALLQRCLAKDPRTRLRDIGEARVELADPATLRDPQRSVSETQPRSQRAWIPWTLAALGLGTAAALLALRPADEGQRSAAQPERVAAPLYSFESKTFGQQLVYNARFLPGDAGIAYSAALIGATPDLYLLPKASIVAQRIGPPGTLLLSVSSKGELAVLTDAAYINHRVHVGTLARMSAEGSPRPLIEGVRDADWGPDGELAIVRRQGGLDRLEYPVGTLLYESSGYVSEPRVSADGTRVAFLDHGFWRDDRGWVKVVDRAGVVTTLTEEMYSVQGLVWSTDGQRLYYSGDRTGGMTEPRTSGPVAQGVSTPAGSSGNAPAAKNASASLASSASVHDMLQVYSTSASAKDVRKEFGTPGDMIVVDAAADGRWLMLQKDDFYGVGVHLPARSPASDAALRSEAVGGNAALQLLEQPQDIDLSWLDRSWNSALSPDAQTLAFTNGNGGAGYTVVTRRIDGSPISTLGDGEMAGFSPDGRWVCANLMTTPQLVLYPTGAGAPRYLERGPIESYAAGVQWFPDSKSILFGGRDASRAMRSYRQAIDGDPKSLPEPVLPVGVVGALSPLGDRVLFKEEDGTWRAYPLDGSAPSVAPGLEARDAIVAWSPAGDAVFVTRSRQPPMKMERVELATGARSGSFIVGPPPAPGLVSMGVQARIFDPERAYAYGYRRQLSRLFVMR